MVIYIKLLAAAPFISNIMQSIIIFFFLLSNADKALQACAEFTSEEVSEDYLPKASVETDPLLPHPSSTRTCIFTFFIIVAIKEKGYTYKSVEWFSFYRPL